MEVRRELTGWLQVDQPAVWLSTRDERAALGLLELVGSDLIPARSLLTWRPGEGLLGLDSAASPPLRPLPQALAAVRSSRGRHLLVLISPDLDDPDVSGVLRDHLRARNPLSQEVVTPVVVIGPNRGIPESLQGHFIELMLPPASPAEMEPALKAALRRYRDVWHGEPNCPADIRPILLNAVAGLAGEEAERVFLKVLSVHGDLSLSQLPALQREKCRLLLTHSLVSHEELRGSLDLIGGLGTFKDWVKRRAKAATDPWGNHPQVRGALLVGLPGCGQSAAVRAAAQTWGLPLIRLDGAQLGLEGACTTTQLADLLHHLELASPVVLWLFRLDQAFIHRGEEGGRALTPAALMMEQWLLSRGRRTIVMATASEPERLPMDVVVRGCFDETFLLDFPNSEERRHIFRIVLERRGLKPEDLNVEMLIAASDGFSGAQIAQSIDRGMIEGLDHGRTLKMVDLLQSLRHSPPMAATLAEHRRRIRTWAHRRAISATPPRDA